MAKTILIFLVLAGTLIAPADLSSCGPFFTETLFSSRRGPFDPADYFAGHLDILEPSYRRIYQIAAYRYLSGIGLTSEDQHALNARPEGPDFWSGDQSSPAVKNWLQARVLVGAPPLDHIDRFSTSGQNEFFLNCGDDAFTTATQTFNDRFRAGLNHDDLRAWVAAQDTVFVNCALPGQIPDPVAKEAPSWMRSDRAYQVAAAKFYAGGFDAAHVDFLRIAEDRSSPWHAIAPYLAARALIRKTTLVDPGAASAAEAQLRKVLADPVEAKWHESARGLIRYLRMRSDPWGVLNELARNLETQKADVASIMNDYRILLDRMEGRQQNLSHDADLTDWLTTMQHDSDNHALERWHATRSLPWLIAALTWASQPDDELMKAAALVPDSSPGYLTAQCHRLRLLPAGESRPLLDAVLRRHLSVSARNLFLAERMRTARNWDELLRYAPRTAAGTFDSVAEEPAKNKPAKYFDEDAATILNREAPLTVLRQAAQSPSLPPNLRLDLARSVWVRAIMLNDTALAKDIAPELATLAPPLKTLLDSYLAAPDEESRNFAAVYLLLNNPGMRPTVESGPGRETPTARIDNFRQNWWCAWNPGMRQPLNAPLTLLYQGAAPEAGFISVSELATAQRQAGQIQSFPSASTFMTRRVLAWADSHPDDPRVPEALHLAVRGVRYACSVDANTSLWAKRAFQLLHSRYPKSEAARRTPYWFAGG